MPYLLSIDHTAKIRYRRDDRKINRNRQHRTFRGTMGISLRLTAREEDVLQAFDKTSEQEPTMQTLAAHTDGMKTNGVSQVLTHLQNKKLVTHVSGEGSAKRWKKLPPPSSEPSEASIVSTSE